jgi:hypothetical protein
MSPRTLDAARAAWLGQGMQKNPAIGDSIIYVNPSDGEKCAAIVVKVWNAEGVSLVFWNGNGTQLSATSVLMGDGPGRWQHKPTED